MQHSLLILALAVMGVHSFPYGGTKGGRAPPVELQQKQGTVHEEPCWTDEDFALRLIGGTTLPIRCSDTIPKITQDNTGVVDDGFDVPNTLYTIPKIPQGPVGVDREIDTTLTVPDTTVLESGSSHAGSHSGGSIDGHSSGSSGSIDGHSSGSSGSIDGHSSGSSGSIDGHSHSGGSSGSIDGHSSGSSGSIDGHSHSGGSSGSIDGHSHSGGSSGSIDGHSSGSSGSSHGHSSGSSGSIDGHSSGASGSIDGHSHSSGSSGSIDGHSHSSGSGHSHSSGSSGSSHSHSSGSSGSSGSSHSHSSGSSGSSHSHSSGSSGSIDGQSSGSIDTSFAIDRDAGIGSGFGGAIGGSVGSTVGSSGASGSSGAGGYSGTSGSSGAGGSSGSNGFGVSISSSSSGNGGQAIYFPDEKRTNKFDVSSTSSGSRNDGSSSGGYWRGKWNKFTSWSSNAADVVADTAREVGSSVGDKAVHVWGKVEKGVGRLPSVWGRFKVALRGFGDSINDGARFCAHVLQERADDVQSSAVLQKLDTQMRNGNKKVAEFLQRLGQKMETWSLAHPTSQVDFPQNDIFQRNDLPNFLQEVDMMSEIDGLVATNVLEQEEAKLLIGGSLKLREY